ncbi:Holliday junction resolvase RuvX [Xanthomonas citri pv. citri]|nr:Holliday junction resolvase RuvX [Xanthomonas citri pv. citri]MBD4167562.1 Holliday junction resolvase RuvX [Xanthomonas citri pv. citri]
MTTMQLDSDGRLRHLLTLEGLPRTTLLQLLDRAGQIRDAAVGRVGKRSVLAGTAVCTLFFEPSTRTRSSFHLAAQRLGADVLNFDASTSSTRKGETARDTLKNLEAMGVRGFVVRHPDDGDDKDQPARKRAHAFARQLRERYALPVVLIDERSSSVEAAQRFARERADGRKRRRDAEALDAMAAAVIVERWLAAPDQATLLP